MLILFYSAHAAMHVAICLFNYAHIYHIVQQSIDRKSSYSLDPCLSGYILPVGNDGIDGNIEMVSYLLIEHAFGDTDQDFFLP